MLEEIWVLNRQESEINGGSLGGWGEAKIPPYLFYGSFITRRTGGTSGKQCPRNMSKETKRLSLVLFLHIISAFSFSSSVYARQFGLGSGWKKCANIYFLLKIIYFFLLLQIMGAFLFSLLTFVWSIFTEALSNCEGVMCCFDRNKRGQL